MNGLLIFGAPSMWLYQQPPWTLIGIGVAAGVMVGFLFACLVLR